METQTKYKITDIKLKRKRIPQALKYEVDECGFVYRGPKKLAMNFRSGKWYIQLRGNDGKNYTVDSEKLTRQIFGDKELEFSREDVLTKLQARPIEEFPRYAVTSYGAVYCIDPPKRGSRAGERYLLSEKLHNGKRYVTLYHADGRRRTRQVEHLVRDTWGY